MKPVVLITGAAKRLGAAISGYLAGKGWSLILHYNNSREEVMALADNLKGEFPLQNFRPLRCDLSDMKQVMGVFEMPVVKGAEVVALVNNAGTFLPGTLEEISPEFMRQQMDVNFGAPMFLMQAFKKQFGSGSVVNILDTEITRNGDTHAAYLLAKKSLEALTRMAALAWAPSVRVNGVAPGPVLAPAGKGESYLKQMVAQTPLQRKIRVGDIASAVGFLLDNPAITGQVIYCDGGAHLK